jgi:hypothetical protein
MNKLFQTAMLFLGAANAANILPAVVTGHYVFALCAALFSILAFSQV